MTLYSHISKKLAKVLGVYVGIFSFFVLGYSAYQDYNMASIELENRLVGAATTLDSKIRNVNLMADQLGEYTIKVLRMDPLSGGLPPVAIADLQKFMHGIINTSRSDIFAIGVQLGNGKLLRSFLDAGTTRPAEMESSLKVMDDLLQSGLHSTARSNSCYIRNVNGYTFFGFTASRSPFPEYRSGQRIVATAPEIHVVMLLLPKGFRSDFVQQVIQLRDQGYEARFLLHDHAGTTITEFGKKSTGPIQFERTVPFFPESASPTTRYFLTIQMRKLNFLARNAVPFTVIGCLVCIIFFGCRFLLNRTLARLLIPLYRLTADIKNLMSSCFQEGLRIEGPEEIVLIRESVEKLRSQMLQYAAETERLGREAAIGKLAAQVSHDIRSPLTALRVLVGHLGGVPEEHRVMIRNAVQRIEDIANDLRARQEQGAGEAAHGETTRAGDRSVQLLSSLIEPLISEKRTQHRAKLGVEIHAALDAESYGLFAAVHPTELKRVISNLINNAVEAMDRGLVTVAVRQAATLVVISVTDTGSGIPPDVLPRLMQQGVTVGKAGGLGLGLYHARTTLESWDGTLTLASIVGVGTTATLTLPREDAPAWFVPELVLTPGSTIVIVDDDVSIHQIWQERLEALDLVSHEITLQHFSSGTDVVAWFHGQANTLFLCDYEFLGQPNNGLELIEQLGIHDRAILVTSHFDEAPIQLRCAELGVRLIPKGLAGFVPIRVVETAVAAVPEANPDSPVVTTAAASPPTGGDTQKPTALVLDDDDGIRCVWPMEGRRLGFSAVTTFASMEDCEASAPDYAQFDFAFVDKNIPESTWRLDQVITHLKARGVKKVLVASGESARALASDPLCAAADGVIPMKIPQKLPT